MGNYWHSRFIYFMEKLIIMKNFIIEDYKHQVRKEIKFKKRLKISICITFIILNLFALTYLLSKEVSFVETFFS